MSLVQHEDVPYWLRQLRSAIQMNLHDEELWSLAFGKRPVVAAQDAAKRLTVGDDIVGPLPYRFHPPQRILPLAEARSRGFGACGESTAAVAAAVVIAGGEADICYERLKDLSSWVNVCVDRRLVDSYAHVRLLIESTPIDAYPEASFDVPSCSARERVSRSTVRWPADVETQMRSRLVALRTPGGR